jgi:hypothetical protein
VAVYKDFDLNAPGEPPPWGSKELSAFKDIIDTLVSDTIGTKDVTGHKHTKQYNGYSEVIINTTDWVEISLRDYYSNAFTVKVLDWEGTLVGEVLNVDTWNDDKEVRIGSLGVTYPLRMHVDGEVFTRPWQEITSSCTIEGFSEFDTDNYIWMRQIGGLVFVQVHVLGTSDNPFTTIRFPFAMQGIYKSGSFFGYDFSGSFNVVGVHENDSDTLTTENYYGSSTFWQTSGTKLLSGSFVTSVTNPQFPIS